MTQGPPGAQPGPWLAKVFVAYDHRDSAVAEAIVDAIRAYSKGRRGGTIDPETWVVKPT